MHTIWEPPQVHAPRQSLQLPTSPTLPPPALETTMGRLYAADCLTVMRALPAESVDCFFADPPFNLGKDYGPEAPDEHAQDVYISWCHEWMEEGIRLLKPGGAFFLFNLPKWNIPLGTYLNDRLNFRHWIAVSIKFGLPIAGRLYPSHYSLLYYVKGAKPKTFNPPRVPIETCRHCGGELPDYGGYKNKMNPRGVNISDVWTDIAPVRHSRFKKREANELSLKLMDRVLDIGSAEGDLVLDPFGGSGTTYIAAELKGRHWIGTEIATSDAIVNRFANVEPDARNYLAIRSNVNRLFSGEALRKRRQFGHANGKYRLLDET
jgi:site-specific DNA-methyltransferase (adenine-specific)